MKFAINRTFVWMGIWLLARPVSSFASSRFVFPKLGRLLTVTSTSTAEQSSIKMENEAYKVSTMLYQMNLFGKVS